MHNSTPGLEICRTTCLEMWSLKSAMKTILSLLLLWMLVGVLVQAHDGDESGHHSGVIGSGAEGDMGSGINGHNDNVDASGSGVIATETDLGSGSHGGMSGDGNVLGSGDLGSATSGEGDDLGSGSNLGSGDLGSGMSGNGNLGSGVRHLTTPGQPKKSKLNKPHSKKAKHHGKRKTKKSRIQRLCKVKNCAVCGLKRCKRCKPGYKLTKTKFTKRCISKCPPGHKFIKGRCAKPSKNACRGIPHCAKCRNAMIPWLRKCEVCKKGWYRYKGTYEIKTKCIKKCPTGYAAKKTRKGSFCKKIKGRCPRGCKRCSTVLRCVKCSKGFAKFNLRLSGSNAATLCVRRCPKSYKKTFTKGKGFVCQISRPKPTPKQVP